MPTDATDTASAADQNLIDPQQLPDSSFIYDTSLEDLAGADSYYDGQTVQVTGEAVGDAVRAEIDGSMRWVTLESLEEPGGSALAVYMTEGQAGLVDTFGDYAATGTTLRVQGTYHLVCSEHEGISDVHAETVSVVSPGEARVDDFDPMAFVPGIVLVIVGCVLLLAFRFVRERGR